MSKRIVYVIEGLDLDLKPIINNITASTKEHAMALARMTLGPPLSDAPWAEVDWWPVRMEVDD
jgi:hypothetical protein